MYKYLLFMHHFHEDPILFDNLLLFTRAKHSRTYFSFLTYVCVKIMTISHVLKIMTQFERLAHISTRRSHLTQYIVLQTATFDLAY